MLDIVLDNLLRDLVIHDGVLRVEEVSRPQDGGHKSGILKATTFLHLWSLLWTLVAGKIVARSDNGRSNTDN